MNQLKRSQVHKEYVSRFCEMLSPNFHEKKIGIVGCGAGSYAAEKLTRLCPATIKLCDYDRVEFPNLSRTNYTISDAEQKLFKVDALENRLRNINPFVEVETLNKDITQISDGELETFASDLDLIIAGTDHFPAQALMNQISLQYRIPVIFVGIHEGAKGGRILWSIPGQSACYRCMVPERYEALENGDGESLKLEGAQGTIIDAHFIDMIALKISVAILERNEDSPYGHFFRSLGDRNEVIVRCFHDYPYGNELQNLLLAESPDKDELGIFFHSMNTVWLHNERINTCPDCLKYNTNRNTESCIR